jgi:hypothetical protein
METLPAFPVVTALPVLLLVMMALSAENVPTLKAMFPAGAAPDEEAEITPNVGQSRDV